MTTSAITDKLFQKDNAYSSGFKGGVYIMKKITAIAAVFVLLFSLTACKDKKSPASYPSFGITEHAEGSLPDFLPATGSDAPSNPVTPSPSFTLPSGDNGKDEKTAPFIPSIPDGSDDFGDDFRYNIDPEDLERFKKMDAYKIRALAVRKSQLISDLFFAFAKAQLDIDIDETSGIVTLDETVLFSGDSAVLSESGKEFLNKFIGAYASVLLKEKYDGFISKVFIEGHTARLENSTYESGLPLSTERANTVKNYCLSASAGLENETVAKLAAFLFAEGCSNSRPVLNEDGSINLDQSRRVTFRFTINID